MKHYYLLLLLCLFGISNVLKAEKVERVIFNYTLDNFKIECEDELVSVSGRGLMFADHPPFEPAVPVLYYSEDIPTGMEYVGYRVTVPDTVLICNNKLLAKYPAPICYNEELRFRSHNKAQESKTESCENLKGIFPPEKIICDADGYILYPFEYNSDTKELFFTPTVIVDRILVSEDDLRDVSQIQSSEESDEIISISIYNGAKEVEEQECLLPYYIREDLKIL